MSSGLVGLHVKDALAEQSFPNSKNGLDLREGQSLLG